MATMNCGDKKEHRQKLRWSFLAMKIWMCKSILAENNICIQKLHINSQINCPSMRKSWHMRVDILSIPANLSSVGWYYDELKAIFTPSIPERYWYNIFTVSQDTICLYVSLISWILARFLPPLVDLTKLYIQQMLFTAGSAPVQASWKWIIRWR